MSGLARGRTGPNKATKDLKTFWGQVFTSESYRANVIKRMLAGKAPHLETYLFAIIYGKPKESVDLTHDFRGPVPVQHIHQVLSSSGGVQ